MSTFISLIDWTFLLAGLLTALLLIIKSIQNYRVALQDKKIVIVKAVAVFALWLALSFAMLLVNGLFAFAALHTIDRPRLSQPVKFEEAIVYVIGLNLAYIIAGCGLVYWARRQGRVRLR